MVMHMCFSKKNKWYCIQQYKYVSYSSSLWKKMCERPNQGYVFDSDQNLSLAESRLHVLDHLKQTCWIQKTCGNFVIPLTYEELSDESSSCYNQNSHLVLYVCILHFITIFIHIFYMWYWYDSMGACIWCNYSFLMSC